MNVQQYRRNNSIRWPIVLALALAQATPLLAQDIWNNAAGTTNWTNPGNWSFNAIPTSGDTVLFDMFSLAAPAALLDNIVHDNFTIASLTYQTLTHHGS